MKKIKKAIWIPSVIVGIIAIAILTLSLVKVSPIQSNFGDYSRVELLRSGDGSEFNHIVLSDGTDLTENMLQEGIKSTRFSVMQAMLEGKFSFKPKMHVVTKDDEEEEVTITAAAIKAFAALEGEYVLKFYYDEVKTVTVDDKEIKYDRMLVRLVESNGEVMDIECVPYLEYNIDNESTSAEYDSEGRIGSIHYTTSVIVLKMNTSEFMMSIEEFLNLYE